MKKLQEWLPESKWADMNRQVIKAFERWYKANLNITHGSGRTAEDIFGLPYTSTSSFAALWNCQAEAELKTDKQWKFNYLAISENKDIIVGFDRENTGNFDTKEIIIGKVEM